MKLFTIQEANALLPSVREILARIQRAHRRVTHYRDDARKAAEAAEQGGGGIENGVAYANVLTRLTAEMSELDTLGVQLKDFERGLIDLRRRNQLYVEYPRGVEISEGVLYRARIAIPAQVPVGTYTAETFLIRDGRVIAGAAREIRIEKLGFEGFIAEAAERWSLAYGLVAVALSLLLGWAASAFFQRRYA